MAWLLVFKMVLVLRFGVSNSWLNIKSKHLYYKLLFRRITNKKTLLKLLHFLHEVKTAAKAIGKIIYYIIL
jgi:ribosomal protein L35AE/L33A